MAGPRAGLRGGDKGSCAITSADLWRQLEDSRLTGYFHFPAYSTVFVVILPDGFAGIRLDAKDDG